MKKWIAILLSIAMSVSLLACDPVNLSTDDIRNAGYLLQGLADGIDGVVGVESSDSFEGETEETDSAEDENVDEISENSDASSEVSEDGFETFLTDEPCNPGDDFYSYVNYDRIRSEKVPAGYSVWSVLYRVNNETTEQLKNIILEAADTFDGFDMDSPEYKVGAFYETISDFDARNEIGIEPIMKYIEAIDNAQTLDELVDADLMYFNEVGQTAFLECTYMIDKQDSNKYAGGFGFASDGKPGKEVITDPDMQEYKENYLTYLGEIFRIAGYDKLEATLKVASAFNLLKEWEERTLPKEEQYDPENNIRYSKDELIRKFKNLPVERYMDTIGLDLDTYYTTETEPLEFLDSIYDEENIEMFRNIMIARVLLDNATVLSEKMYNAYRKYVMAMNGLEEDADRETLLTEDVSEWLPTELGELYVGKYSSPKIKEDVTEMIHEIIDAYREEIKECEWMSDSTKDKALEKLDKMRIQAVYPDEWINEYQTAEIKSKKDGGSLFDNTVQINLAYVDYAREMIKKPVDKDKWVDYPQTVNALYFPSNNSITITAAILQKGIYDVNATRATNLGAIGMIIGHEISHAFDVTGSQYDADGNVKNWWADEDFEKYEKICNAVRERYSQFEVIPNSDLYVNGDLTLGENMADMSSMQVINKICDQDAEMFKEAATSLAILWGSKQTHDSTLYRLKVDTHSPAKARVNVPVQMCNLFYEAFDINPGDDMYIDKENRITIW